MPKKKGGHLTLKDRITIQDMLHDRYPLNEIADTLDVSWATIASEIKKHRTQDSPRFAVLDRNLCRFKRKCTIRGVCRIGCTNQCALCDEGACNRVCDKFEMIEDCEKLHKAPYCCNGCRQMLSISCKWAQWFYDARIADDEANFDLISSRSGIDCTEEELEEMVSTVKPLLKKGQSLEHIWQTHPGKFPVSCRTFYRYVAMGILDVINLDLPKKVKYKPRKKKKDGEVPFKPNPEGRTYEDFRALSPDQQMSVVEMDCVEPGKGGEKTILTLYFRRICFQLMILMPAHTSGCVREALDWIEMLCGKDLFRALFGTILTDRGHEFMCFDELERSIDGGKRCKIYYCDPLCSGQKGACEKAHVELRKILKKGTTFEDMDNADMAVICSHVNSYTRKVLGGASPFDLAEKVLPKDLLEGLGLVHIDPEKVIMKPTLLRELGLR